MREPRVLPPAQYKPEVVVAFLGLDPEEKVRLQVGLLCINTQPWSKLEEMPTPNLRELQVGHTELLRCCVPYDIRRCQSQQGQRTSGS